MAENTEATDGQTPEQQAGAEQGEPQGEPQKPETDWKAEARKWEKRAKESAPAVKRLQELEESQKSETEKLQDQLKQAQQALAQRESEALRLRVVAKHQIPTEFADLVRGDDEDGLEASAKKVAALVKGAARKGSVIPTQGRQPDISAAEGGDWLRNRFQHRK